VSRIVPFLRYDDTARARAFLIAAFGFRDRPSPAAHGEHGHSHIELELDDGSWIKLGPMSTSDTARTGTSRALVQVIVDDIDTHFARAAAAGATIVDGLQDGHGGDRLYWAADPEGQLWSFVRPAETG
jgi:uncharacterized glyoxalase superfamily protein PhnB